MIALYEDAGFLFRFVEPRIIERIHLEGVAVGVPVSIHKVDPQTRHQQGLLATGITGDGGWVDLSKAIIVQAGDAFLAVMTQR